MVARARKVNAGSTSVPAGRDGWRGTTSHGDAQSCASRRQSRRSGGVASAARSATTASSGGDAAARLAEAADRDGAVLGLALADDEDQRHLGTECSRTL